MTLALNIYEEKKTQNTSYIRRPVKRSVDTFKLGNLTNAMNATHKPMPIAAKDILSSITKLDYNNRQHVFKLPSISIQCPVKTQIHTIKTANEKDINSAPVNLPQTPNEILEFKKNYINYST